MNRLLPLAALLLLSFALPWVRGTEPAPLAPERSVASLIPERCLIYLEGTGLHPLFEQGLEHPAAEHLLASELGRAALAALPLTPADALTRADAWLGEPALALLADLTSRGLALGFEPRTKKTVVVALGRNAARVEQGLARVLGTLAKQYGSPGALDRPQKNWSGADVWSVGAAFVARRSTMLVLGNDEELVQATLALAADPAGRGLLARPGFAAQHDADAAGVALWSWLELAQLDPFGDDGFHKLRAAEHTPAVQALLGAEIGALLSAHALAGALTLDPDGIALRFRAFEAPAAAAALVPHARAGALPAELDADKHDVASALLYRDYAGLFRTRSALFPAETLPGFAEAITNGALFFEGRDLGEEVLPALSPWLRVVARELEFTPERKPEIPLPGVALVAVLADEHAGEQWMAAFQTIVSIANVDQAQKGGSALRLHLEREGEVEVCAARFAAPMMGEGVDVRYNLEPALAVVGRHLVLGTHAQLVHTLVRELATRAPLDSAGASESLALDARGLERMLAQNLTVLVAQQMLEKGVERSAAEENFQWLRRVLATLSDAHVGLQRAAPSEPELTLELGFAPDASAR